MLFLLCAMSVLIAVAAGLLRRRPIPPPLAPSVPPQSSPLVPPEAVLLEEAPEDVSVFDDGVDLARALGFDLTVQAEVAEMVWGSREQVRQPGGIPVLVDAVARWHDEEWERTEGMLRPSDDVLALARAIHAARVPSHDRQRCSDDRPV